MMRQYIRVSEEQGEDEWHEGWNDFLQVFKAVRSVFRGLVFMLSPIPGDSGSTLDDLLLCHPHDSHRAVVIKILPRLGRALISRLQQDKHFWDPLRKSAEAHCGSDMKNAKAGKHVCETLQAAAEQAVLASELVPGED